MRPVSTPPPRASRCLSIMNIHGAGRRRRKACRLWTGGGPQRAARGHIVSPRAQLVRTVYITAIQLNQDLTDSGTIETVFNVYKLYGQLNKTETVNKVLNLILWQSLFHTKRID